MKTTEILVVGSCARIGSDAGECFESPKLLKNAKMMPGGLLGRN
jgi:hypothetical protein